MEMSFCFCILFNKRNKVAYDICCTQNGSLHVKCVKLLCEVARLVVFFFMFLQDLGTDDGFLYGNWC